MLVVDTSKRGLGAEIRQRQYGSAVGHGGGHRQHHAEAMEHGHLDHHAVGSGQIHAVADILTVVDDIIMGQHDALGEAGGTRGVLHIAHIVLIHLRRHAIDLALRRFGSVSHRLFP